MLSSDPQAVSARARFTFTRTMTIV